MRESTSPITTRFKSLIIQTALFSSSMSTRWRRRTRLNSAPTPCTKRSSILTAMPNPRSCSSAGSRPKTTTAHITQGHEGAQFFAGFRSDPFFFDLAGFLHGLQFTGADFFIDKNVYGIALDIPNYLLGPNPKVGIWTRTLVPMTMQPERLTQVDQMGRPGINTVFNHGNDKNLFNVTQPADQRTVLSTVSPTTGQTLLSVFQQELQALSEGSLKGQYTAEQALSIAQILLPDVLTYDYTSAAGYLNGRRLQDDVIDISLNLATNGKVTGDGVGPHTDYLADFPYLGKPHA